MEFDDLVNDREKLKQTNSPDTNGPLGYPITLASSISYTSFLYIQTMIPSLPRQKCILTCWNRKMIESHALHLCFCSDLGKEERWP